MVVDLSILNVGWASMYNSGAGVNGGQGGTTHEFNEASVFNGETGFNALWEFMRGDNLLTPMILIWTGGDVDLPQVNYRIDAGENTTSGSPKNKTIIGSTGQLITGATFRMWGWENIIWLNFKRKDIPVINTDPRNNGDGWSVLGCTGVIIGFCEMNGEYSINLESGIGDGGIDTGEQSNYCSYVNCYFNDMVRGALIVGSNDAIENIGLNKVSFVRCRGRQMQIRQPFARFGQVHMLECLFHYDPVFNPNLANQYDWAGIGELGFEAQMIYERCYLDTHRFCFRDNDSTPEPRESGLKAIDCFFGPQWSGESSNRWNDTIVNIRESNATFDPWNIVGYTYPSTTLTAQQAKDYTIQWAGAVYHLIEPPATEFSLTVQSSNPTFGTVSRSLSNPVTAGATDVLTATPVGTGVFQGWYLGSVSFANFITNDNPYNRVVNSDATVVASFIDGTPIPPEQPRKKWAKKRN